MLKPILLGVKSSKSYSESIIPENIKDIEVVADALDIFIDYVGENCNISIDIKNMFDKDNKIINDELLKIYLNNVYNLLDTTKKSNAIHEAFQNDPILSLSNEEIPVIRDVTSIMDVEQYLTSKNYKETKGTKLGFQYIYDLVLNSGVLGDAYSDSESEFKYSETNNIFEYKINGAISPQLYSMLVEPIAHPLGWNYVYSRLFTFIFSDYFKVKFTYDFTDGYLQVKCQQQGSDVVHDYISGTIYYEDDFNNPIGYITEVQNRDVILIETLRLQKGFKHIIYFKSGEILVNTTYPITTKLYASKLAMDSSQEPLIDYDEIVNGQIPHCSLFTDFKTSAISGLEEDLVFDIRDDFKDYANFREIGPFIIGESFIDNAFNIDTDDDTDITGDAYGDNNIELVVDNADYTGMNEEDLKPRIGWFFIGGQRVEHRIIDDIQEVIVDTDLNVYDLDKFVTSNVINDGLYTNKEVIGGSSIGASTISINLESVEICTYK